MSGRYQVAAKADRTLDGITFDSRAEMNRYAELHMMERAGLIKDLETQPEYVLQPGFRFRGASVRPITYRADFRYLDIESNRIIVEDQKGHPTAEYKIKKKMLLYNYPDINFMEVKG